VLGRTLFWFEFFFDLFCCAALDFAGTRPPPAPDMQSPLLKEHPQPVESEAFVIEDGTGLLASRQCYYQRRGEVVTGPVWVLHPQTGVALALTAVDVPSIPALPEMQRSDSSVIVLPSGLCSTATTVVVQPRRGNKKKKRAAVPDSACVVVQGPCVEALPVAVALPAVAPGPLALRKGAAWLLAISVAQLCLLSPIATAAAVAGICASAPVLASSNGGIRAARRIKMFATLSGGLTVGAILLTTLLFASAVPATVRHMADTRARVCGGPSATPDSPPPVGAAPAWAGATDTSDPAWSSLWNFPLRVRKSSSSTADAVTTGGITTGGDTITISGGDSGGDRSNGDCWWYRDGKNDGSGTYIFLTTSTAGGRWLSERAGDAIAKVSAGSNAGGERKLFEVQDRHHAFREDSADSADSDASTPSAAQRDSCGRALRLIWILVGVAFITVVMGLQLAAGIAAAFVAREAAKLVRHAPVIGVAAGVSV
jgi:hypothetical protein